VTAEYLVVVFGRHDSLANPANQSPVAPFCSHLSQRTDLHVGAGEVPLNRIAEQERRVDRSEASKVHAMFASNGVNG